MTKRFTINDIAKLAGVSKATVSYFLNGNYQKMSTDTKEKIQDVITKTGYIPNKIAKSLATNNTKTIGVIIADITNPFISSVIKGIHDSCKNLGYSVTFTNSNNDLKIEQKNIKRLYHQNVSGIIMDSIDPSNENINLLDPMTTILVDKQEKIPTIDSVVSDNSKSTTKFLNLMKAAGYDDLYFVSFPLNNISTRQIRYQAFQECVSKDPNHLIIINDKYPSQEIAQLIEKKQGKIGFFTMNGPVLLELMKILNQYDYHYPFDFGIGTYENLDWMEVLNPAISCIAQDSYEIGFQAAKHLITKLETNENPQQPKIIQIENQIIIRHSF